MIRKSFIIYVLSLLNDIFKSIAMSFSDKKEYIMIIFIFIIILDYASLPNYNEFYWKNRIGFVHKIARNY